MLALEDSVDHALLRRLNPEFSHIHSQFSKTLNSCFHDLHSEDQ